jgi:hypothetical protein
VSDPKRPADPAYPATDQELDQFLQRARRGDPATLPVLRTMLERPQAVDALGGDLARQAERSFIKAAAGDDLAFAGALERKLTLLRAELAGPDPTPVERLLVERAVACWLQVQDADVRYAQAKNLSVEGGDYCQRRMDHAHRRYLSALKTLALVRKLAVPVLQVNIARKQVNVAGTCPVAGGEGDGA